MQRASAAASAPSAGPLMSAAVVCRACPQLAGVALVAAAVSAFLDGAALWTLPGACKRGVAGLERLLARIAAREDPTMDPLLKRSLFSAGLEAAAERGDLGAVQWLMESYLPAGRVRHAVEKAAAAGQLRVLQWLRARHDSRVVWGRHELRLALENGRVETARWLYESVPSARGVDRRQLRLAALRSGGAKAAEWLWASRLLLPIDRDALLAAAKRGNPALVEWAATRLDVALDDRFMDAAASAGSLRLMRLLATRGCASVKAGALCKAAKKGAFGVVEWAVEELAVRDRSELVRAVDSAAKSGRLDVVERLHRECDGQRSARAMDCAAAFGHLEVVKWLHENTSGGCTTAAMDLAAGNGHLEVVQWLHEHRAEGCTSAAMDAAAAGGRLETVQWLHANRSEGCTTRAMDGAAAGGFLRTVQWLDSNRLEGCTADAMDSAAAAGSLETVEWLHSHRTEGCTERAMDQAAGNGHLGVVQWLYKHRGEGCVATAMECALWDQHFHVVRWLHERCGQPVDDEALCAAVASRDVDNVRWVLARSDARAFSGRPADVALVAGDVEILIALRADGRCELPGSWDSSAPWNYRLEALQWLVREAGEAPASPQGPADVYWHDCLLELESITESAA